MNPYVYAPKAPSLPYQQPLDTREVRYFSSTEPLSLAEILDIALRNNPSTKLTWAKARAAAAFYGQELSPLYPTLSGTYQYERSKTTFPPEFGTPRFVQYLTDWGPQLSLSYTLLDFGLTQQNAEAAKQALFFADFTHNRQIQTVLQQVADDYYNYLSQIELMKARDEDLCTAETSYCAAKKELDAGVKSTSDLLQTETKLIQAQIDVINQKQNIVNARISLLTQMGIDSNQKIEIQCMPEVPPIDQMVQSANQVLAVALEKRADLTAAEANVRSQEAAVSAAWRQFLPNVVYNATAFQESSRPGGNLRINYTSTVNLNFPLFEGFATLNNLRQARAIKEQAEAQLRQTELNVIQDVMTAHSTVKTAFETMHCTDVLLKTAEKQYDVALCRYRAGVADILELLSAQSTLSSARSEQVSTTNQWLNALVNLSYAAGTITPPKPKEIQ